MNDDDDLVMHLRASSHPVCGPAADRIEELEAKIAERERVIEAISTAGIDRTIGLGWNEAIEAGEKRLRERGDCCWPPIRRVIFHEAADTIRALRKLEEGDTPADRAAETGYDPGRDM